MQGTEATPEEKSMRHAKAFLALSLVTCTAVLLAAGPAAAAPEEGRVVTFNRTASAPANERTWYVVTGRTTFDEDDAGDVTIPTLPTSLPRDAAGRLQLLQSAGLALDASTLEEALHELQLPFMFAGREQWVRNLTTADGAGGDPRLWNVTMENPITEENSLRILLGRASWAASERGTMADDVAYWESLVPDWAPEVRDQLAAEGYPFSLELLASPEVQFDRSQPLFAKGSHPASLFGLGVLQSGENAFLRSMGADNVLLELWPLYYRYHHRAAGAPVPDDLKAGLTFGTVIAESCPEQTADGCINGLRYRHTAVMDTDAYKAWTAYGMPGSEGDGQHNGYVVDSLTGWAYNPTTGEFFQAYEVDTFQSRWLEMLQNGSLQPSYFITPWEEVVSGGLGSRIAAAGFLRDPSIWFSGPYAPYAHDLLPEGALDRYKTLVAGK
jgi:hypothetical protein